MSETTETRFGTSEAVSVFGRALSYVRPLGARMVGKGALTFLSLVPALIAPWPAKLLIDQVILDRPLDASGYPPFLQGIVAQAGTLDPWSLLIAITLTLLAMILLFGIFGGQGPERDITEGNLASGVDTATSTENQANLGFSFAGGLFGLFDYRYTIRLTQELNHYYRSQLFSRIQSLPMPAFADARVGDAIYRIMYDTPAITSLVYEVLLTPFVTTCQILLIASILLTTYPEQSWLAWTALLLGPVVWVVGLPFTRWIRQSGEESRVAGSESTATLEEGLSNVLAVQSLGGEARERARFDRDSGSSFAMFRGFIRAIAAAVVAIAIVVAALLVWGTIVLTDLIIEGLLTPGDFAVLAGYFGQLAGYAGRFGSVWIRVQGNLAGLRRVFWLMDLPSETDTPGARPLQHVERSVRLRGVRFDYPDGSRALSDVDVELEIGKVTALVGPAGAGKTTLAALVPRFLEPSAGRDEVDGVDVRELTLHSLRSQISFVFQETALLDASVEENIRLGRPDASEAEVRRAAQIAGAHEFIQELPEGYRTSLGRSGGKLSVGQRQRVALARALVRDTPILILDEPTSALDPATEHTLVRALREAARERAVLVIAHRLGSIREADEIVFLEDGHVRERGRHEELMTRPDGAYRRFVALQGQGAA